MDAEETVPVRWQITRSQKQLVALIAAVTIGSIVYRLLVLHRLEQTSLLFIGLPAILAMVLALGPPAKSMTGGTLRGVSIFLLLSGPLLGEGFICILMAAPIFLGVALVVSLLVESLRSRSRRRASLGCCLLVLLPMSLEGTSPSLSFDRFDQVEVAAIVDGSPAQVRQRMSQSPRLDLKLPAYLRMGFPRPVGAAGEGLSIGDTRTVHFEGGEGMPEDLVFRVADTTADSVRFEVASDGAEGAHTLGHWVRLREARVTWGGIDPAHTQVTWHLAYERRLDPAWYFAPWERYAGRLAARYLIAANAGPRS